MSKTVVAMSEEQVDNITVESNHVFEGQIIQRNYILNDTGALKKKVRHESRKDPFDQGTEAKDGSNVVVLCKTSFFEHIKKHFIPELIRESQITSIKNAVAAKVNSDSSGEAFVEFSVEVQFTANQHDYTVKLIAYTTSCKIMCQPIGVPSTTKIHSTYYRVV